MARPKSDVKTEGTYYAVHAIADDMEDFTADIREDLTTTIWFSILSWQFPVTQAYMSRFHAEFGQDSADFQVFEKVPAVNARGWQRLNFLVVQCNTIRHERDQSTWIQGENKLKNYIQEFHETRIRVYPVYGIVAVGRLARIFRYIWETDEVEQIFRKEGAEEEPLHLFWDCNRIQEALDFIKDNYI